MSVESGHLQCPFCEGYEVDRLYVASTDVDACACCCCGARWDERRGTGDYVARGAKGTVFMPRRT